MRAGACQRTPDAGAKSAQAFQPRSGAGGQGRGDTHDLGRRELTARELPRADRRGCRRPEHGRACRVRPQDAVAIGAPKPSRQRTRRQRREPTVTYKGQLESGPAHCAVAPSTPPQTLAPSSTRTPCNVAAIGRPCQGGPRRVQSRDNVNPSGIPCPRVLSADHAASSRMRAYNADWPSKPMPGRSDSVRYPPSNLASSAKPPNAPNTPG